MPVTPPQQRVVAAQAFIPKAMESENTASVYDPRTQSDRGRYRVGGGFSTGARSAMPSSKPSSSAGQEAAEIHFLHLQPSARSRSPRPTWQPTSVRYPQYSPDTYIRDWLSKSRDDPQDLNDAFMGVQAKSLRARANYVNRYKETIEDLPSMSMYITSKMALEDVESSPARTRHPQRETTFATRDRLSRPLNAALEWFRAKEMEVQVELVVEKQEVTSSLRMLAFASCL